MNGSGGGFRRLGIWIWELGISGSRHGHLGEDPVEDLVGGGLLGLGLVAEEDPVAKDIMGHVLDVLRRDERAAADEGVGAGREREVDRAAG